MKVIIASDHAGFEMKGALQLFLKGKGYEVVDYGPHELQTDDDYPDYVAPVAQMVSEDPEGSRGIIIGGSGEGEAMIANRFRGVRAAVYYGEPKRSDLGSGERSDLNIITLSRRHNDANILSLGARFLSRDEAAAAVARWLATSFAGEERHLRRIQKIDDLGPAAPASAENL